MSVLHSGTQLVHQCLSVQTTCVHTVCEYVCEAVGEVRGCEGEGYPTVSERKRKKREVRALLHVEKRTVEKWPINECSMRWLCSPEGLGSLADEELTLSGKSQLGTGLCLSFVRSSLCIPVPNPQYFSF